MAENHRFMTYMQLEKAYARSCRPRYDDGGYSGGSMDRPALRRLETPVAYAGELPDCRRMTLSSRSG